MPKYSTIDRKKRMECSIYSTYVHSTKNILDERMYLTTTLLVVKNVKYVNSFLAFIDFQILVT